MTFSPLIMKKNLDTMNFLRYDPPDMNGALSAPAQTHIQYIVRADEKLFLRGKASLFGADSGKEFFVFQYGDLSSAVKACQHPVQPD